METALSMILRVEFIYGTFDKGKQQFAFPIHQEVVHTGVWLNDMRHGRGTEYGVNGLCIYKGQWQHGVRDGAGTEFHADGSKDKTGSMGEQ